MSKKSSFAFNQISAASSNNHALLELDQPYEAPENGYIVVYLSNESSNLTEVYFDDMKVTIEEHPVIEKSDYYPFGMQMAGGFYRENSKENKFNTFQGQERVNDLDVNWISFKWRNHDPSIGRFFNVDPLAEDYYYNSPYAFSENKVVAHVELEGLEAESIKVDPETGSVERGRNSSRIFFGAVGKVATSKETKGAVKVVAGVTAIAASGFAASPWVIGLGVTSGSYTFGQGMDQMVNGNNSQELPSTYGGLMGSEVDSRMGNENKEAEKTGDILSSLILMIYNGKESALDVIDMLFSAKDVVDSGKDLVNSTSQQTDDNNNSSDEVSQNSSNDNSSSQENEDEVN
ncbi:MAG: hypothetical protein RLO81_19770 [Fulvivirga sp.]|uniref:RHS repeat domain-containing protein n=1 Tax=Fulvivirga sp. TaxID=1931237 RepID=UPI0032EB3548